MNAFAQALTANRRLCLLRLLVEARGTSNESVLQLGLQQLGHRMGVDRPYVREQLRFLETAGCLKIEFFQDKVMVAQLTERGASVASGAIACDGVAEPGFGD